MQLKNRTLWLAIVLALLAGGCGRKGPEKPNFLVIIADDLAFRAIGYNNERVMTPHLDQLAREGSIFSRAYIATPVCASSRASILTGLYPQTHGTVAIDSRSFIKNIVTNKKYPTLPQLLNEAGYTTWFSGKSHLGSPRDYGFRHGEESRGYDDARTFEDASAFVDSIAAAGTSRPFLLWVAARQPHLPLHPAPEWLDLYDTAGIPLDKNFREAPPSESFFNQGLPGMNYYRDSGYTNNHQNLPGGPPRTAEIMKEFSRAYYATVSHLDHQIGRLIEQMESKGLMENTMLIFLSDNGYFLGNHGLGNKLTMHEESVRVPFFITWEGIEEEPGQTDALISSIDIFPTILQLAGAAVPQHCQGVDLYALLSGDSPKVRDFVVSESVGAGGSTGEGHRMVVRDAWKYMVSGTGDEALFNLEKDPYELDNQIYVSGREEIVKRLKSNLREWKEMTGDQKKIPGL